MIGLFTYRTVWRLLTIIAIKKEGRTLLVTLI